MDKNPKEKDLEDAMSQYMKFLKKHDDALRDAVAKVSVVAARLYLGSMTLAEHLDFLTHSKKWAKRLEDVDEQPKEIQSWIGSPENHDKMAAALLASMQKHIKTRSKKKKICRSSDSEAAGKSSDKDGDSASNDGSEDDKSEDSASSAQAKKKAKAAVKKNDAGRRKHKDTDSSLKKKKKKKIADDSSEENSAPPTKKMKKKTSDESSGEEPAPPKKMIKGAQVKAAVWTLPDDSEEEALLKGGAAVSVWSISEAQKLEATVETWLTLLGDSKDGPTVAKIKEIFSRIPDEVIDYVDLGTMKNQVASRTTMGRAALKASCDALLAGAKQFLTFTESQSSSGSKGSSLQAKTDDVNKDKSKDEGGDGKDDKDKDKASDVKQDCEEKKKKKEEDKAEHKEKK